MQTSARDKAAPIRILAAMLYIASLLMTPYRTLDPNLQMGGFEILIFGWGSLPNTLAWLANPLLVVSLIVMPKRPTLAIATSTLALLLSMDFKDVQSLGWDSARDVAAGQVTAIDAGAYVWLASIGFTLLASIMSAIDQRTHHANASR
jgi:hypothetical protein